MLPDIVFQVQQKHGALAALLLLHMAALGRDGKPFKMTYREIADAFKISYSSARRCVSVLLAEKLIAQTLKEDNTPLLTCGQTSAHLWTDLCSPMSRPLLTHEQTLCSPMSRPLLTHEQTLCSPMNIAPEKQPQNQQEPSSTEGDPALQGELSKKERSKERIYITSPVNINTSKYLNKKYMNKKYKGVQGGNTKRWSPEAMAELYPNADAVLPLVRECIGKHPELGLGDEQAHELAGKIFEYYSAGDWHMANGRPVKNLKQCVAGWISRGVANGSVHNSRSEYAKQKEHDEYMKEIQAIQDRMLAEENKKKQLEAYGTNEPVEAVAEIVSDEGDF